MNTRASPLYPRAVFYLLSLLAIALVGFWGSYFSRLADNNLVRHAHAASAFAWILLLVSQAWLVRQRKLPLHRRLGRTSLLLAPLFVVSGLFLVQDMLARPGPFIAPYTARLAFIDLTTLAWFAVAYGLALHYRRQTPLHARYMLSTALLVLPPALVRVVGGFVPGITSFDMAFHVGYLVTDGLLLALIVHDLATGRLRPPYVLLLGLTVMQQVAFEVLPGMAWWTRSCAWIAAL